MSTRDNKVSGSWIIKTYRRDFHLQPRQVVQHHFHHCSLHFGGHSSRSIRHVSRLPVVVGLESCLWTNHASKYQGHGDDLQDLDAWLAIIIQVCPRCFHISARLTIPVPSGHIFDLSTLTRQWHNTPPKIAAAQFHVVIMANISLKPPPSSSSSPLDFHSVTIQLSNTVHSSVRAMPANILPRNSTGRHSPPKMTVKHAAEWITHCARQALRLPKRSARNPTTNAEIAAEVYAVAKRATTMGSGSPFSSRSRDHK